MTTLKKVLKDAQKQHYAVGAFNTSNLEITQAILKASEKKKSPVIIAASPKAIDYAGGAHVIADMVQACVNGAKVPVVLHLDHSKTFELVRECVAAGFTSVMFDGSRLQYKDNVRITKKVVALSHAKGVTVEGEIGIIGGKEDYLKKRKVVLADPNVAIDFVNKTGIDALAAAVGTAHGLATDAPEKIDFPLLSKISKSVKVPLVLHGASQGVSDANIKKAIKYGISKVNIDTDLRVAFAKEVRKLLSRDKSIYDTRGIIGAGRSGIEKVVEKKIALFNSQNKAKA